LEHGIRSNFSVEINDKRVDDVAEKIGALFGPEGALVGKAIDTLTKGINIKIETNDD
jgi:hypothetical protein